MNSDQADILDLLAGHTDDSTIERLAFECLMTSLTDDRVASLMNVLGWRGDFDCFAIGGTPETSPASASLVARKAVRDLGGEHVIVGTYGSFLLALVCQSGAATAEVTCTSIMPAFKDDESVYLSPVRSGVAGASHVLRETLFSLQALPLWRRRPARCVPMSCCRNGRCWAMITLVKSCIRTCIRCFMARIPTIRRL